MPIYNEIWPENDVLPRSRVYLRDQPKNHLLKLKALNFSKLINNYPVIFTKIKLNHESKMKCNLKKLIICQIKSGKPFRLVKVDQISDLRELVERFVFSYDFEQFGFLQNDDYEKYQSCQLNSTSQKVQAKFHNKISLLFSFVKKMSSVTFVAQRKILSIIAAFVFFSIQFQYSVFSLGNSKLVQDVQIGIQDNVFITELEQQINFVDQKPDTNQQ